MTRPVPRRWPPRWGIAGAALHLPAHRAVAAGPRPGALRLGSAGPVPGMLPAAVPAGLFAPSIALAIALALPVALALASAAALAQGDEGEGDGIDVRFTSETTAEAIITNSEEGENAYGMRQQADEDFDGEVTEEEAEAMAAFFEQAAGSQFTDPRGAPTLDGEPPSRITLEGVAFEGLVGDAERREPPVIMRVTIRPDWDIAGADRHIFVVEGDEGGSGDGTGARDTLRLEAPPGFRVGEVTGLSDVQRTGDRVVQGTGSGEEVRLVLEAGGAGADGPATDLPTPGPGTGLLLLAAAGGGRSLATRRRPRLRR